MATSHPPIQDVHIRVSDENDMKSEAATEGLETVSTLSNLRLRAPLSPRATDSIRLRMKIRRRHSSGSDDSINQSLTGTILPILIGR